MYIFPTEEDIETAVNLLVDKYHISMNLLGDLFGKSQRDQANDILPKLGGKRLDRLDVARLLILKKGTELFSGSDENVRELRQKLISQLSNELITKLFESHQPSTISRKSPSHMIAPLAEKKWHAGGPWSRDFVEALGFPQIFAGVVQRDTSPTVEIVDPLQVPPKLKEFQQDLKNKMLDVLKRDGDKTRCVVTLPTGGGKTRVAVEAFIDWMQPRFESGKFLIWIAQSEELCEQAIACIAQMWGSREFVSPLKVYRYFGGRARNMHLDDLTGGAVVTSIQQLDNRIKSGDKILDRIIKDCGAMIIDEAHRATTPMYDRLLEKAEELCGADLFPICGLTATPGRTGLFRGEETTKLVNRFQAYLIKPDLGDEYADNPLRFFREKKYLARAHHIIFESGMEYELTDEEIEQINRELADYPPRFIKELADDNKRNRLIIQRLLEIPKETPTLIYACSVDHAYFLSVILTEKGRRAGAISADTPLTLRRGLIQDFKNGKLDFLSLYSRVE